MLDVSELDKDGLAEYAKATFSADLDMRKGLEKLRAEVVAMQLRPVASDVEDTHNPKATHIKNLDTGFFFPWTKELKKGLLNAVDCDSFGEPV